MKDILNCVAATILILTFIILYSFCCYKSYEEHKYEKEQIKVMEETLEEYQKKLYDCQNK